MDLPTTTILRQALLPVARLGTTISYAQAASALGLQPPHSIRRLALGLEALMAEDAAARLPLLAAVVVSPRRGGLPAPGFFETARALGQIEDGEDERAAHARLIGAVCRHYAPRG